MQFLEKEIVEYTRMIWSAQLALPLTRLETQNATQPWGRAYRSAIQVSGNWNGWIVMDMAPELAERATQNLFGEAQSPSDENIEETLKELANQVGGNLKNIMPQPTRILFPIVSLDGRALHFPDTQVVSRIRFHWESFPLEIQLLEYQTATDTV